MSLMAKTLLEDLSIENSKEEYKDDNDDLDFGEVLKIFSDDMSDEYRASRKIRYADGEEEPILFGD